VVLAVLVILAMLVVLQFLGCMFALLLEVANEQVS
jgi:hypothetical protein